MRSATASRVGLRREQLVYFGGQCLVCSAKHKIQIWDDLKLAWCWKTPNALRVGRHYVPFRLVARQGTVQTYTCAQAWLFGMFVGNGCLQAPVPGKRGATVTVACGLDEALAEAVVEAARSDRFNGKILRTQSGYGSPSKQYTVVWYSKGMHDVFRQKLCLSYARGPVIVSSKGRLKELKRVPKDVYTDSRQVRLACLSGLIDSDGSIDKSGRVSFSTIHSLIARDVQRLATSLGVHSRIREQSSDTSTGRVFIVTLSKPDSSALELCLRSHKAARFVYSPGTEPGCDVLSFPPGYARESAKKLDYKLPSSAKAESFTAMDHMIKKARLGRGCGHGFARRVFGFPRDYIMLPFERVVRGDMVPMFDPTVHSTDKRVITNGFVTHNSDFVFEVYVGNKEGRMCKHRNLKVTKGRDSGYGEIRFNFLFSPKIDFSELANVDAAGVDKERIKKLAGAKHAKKRVDAASSKSGNRKA